MSIGEFAFTSLYRPVVEVGVGDTRTPTTSSLWGNARWGTTGRWSGREPSWVDVTCFTESWEMDVGREFAVDRFPPSTVTATFTNESGWANQNAPNALDFRPGRAIRFALVDYLGQTWPMWRGFVDAITPSYAADRWDEVTVHAVDAVGEVGLYQRLELPTAVGAGETSAARLTRLLNEALWPTDWRKDWDTSSVTLLGTTMAQPFVDEIGQLMESEGGAVFATPEGFITFRNRDWLTAPLHPPDLRIGNTGAPGEVCPTSWEVSRDRGDTSLATRVIVGVVLDAIAPIQLDSPPAQAKYGVQVVERRDLACSASGQLRVLGQRMLRTKSTGDARVMAVNMAATTDPAGVFGVATTCRLDRRPPVQVAGAHVNEVGNVLWDDVYYVNGYGHRFTRDEWELRLSLERAAPFVNPAGHWGSALWGNDGWGHVT